MKNQTENDLDNRLAEIYKRICTKENDITLLKNLIDKKEMDDDFIKANMKELFFRNRN